MKSAIPFALGLLTLAVSSTLYAATDDTYELPSVVVTATRFPDQLDATPTNVTIITRKQIEDSGAQTVTELLQSQAGINTRSTDGSPNQSVDMRGFGASGNQNVVILLDDMRLNENELAPARLASIPLDAVDHIEIIRGSGAVLYGAGATGGVIRVVTRSADSSKAAGYVQAGAGSYNGYSLRGGMSKQYENGAVRFDASTYDTNNYRQNNAVHQDTVLVSGSRNFGQGTLSLRLGGEEQQLQLPGSRTVDANTGENQLAAAPQGASTPNDWSNLASQFAVVSWSAPLGAGRFIADIGQRERQQHAYLSGSYIGGSSSQTTVSPRYRLPYTALNGSHFLVVGADWSNWDYDSSSHGGWSNYSLVGNQQNQSVYFDNVSSWNQTTVSVGARQEQVEQTASNTQTSSTYANGKQTNTVNAWELGAKHRFDRVAVFGKVGQSYRLPVIDEIVSYGTPLSTPLKPQTSHDSEAGVEYVLDNGKLRATAYQMNLNNELHYNAITYSNMNLSPTRRQGVELEGNWHLSPVLDVFANYTYADAKFVSGVYSGVNVTGKRVPLVPRHSASAGFDWKVGGGHRVSMQANYVGQQIYDNDQSNTFGQQIPAYTTVDAKWQYLHGNWRYSFAVNNLTNEKYYTYGIRSSTLGRFNAYPMPERNFWATAEYRFH